MILSRLVKYSTSYEAAFKRALIDPVSYWKDQAKNIKWHSFPKTTLRVDDLHFHRWFPDGQINITEQCLDVHLQDRGNQIAYFV